MVRLFLKNQPNKFLLSLIFLNMLICYIVFLEVVNFTKRIQFSTEIQVYCVRQANISVPDYAGKDIKKDEFFVIYGGISDKVGVILHSDGFLNLSQGECAVNPDAGIAIGKKVVYDGVEYTVGQTFNSPYEIILPKYAIGDAMLEDIFFIGKGFLNRRTIARELSSAFDNSNISMPEKVSYTDFLIKNPIMIALLMISVACVCALAFCINYVLSKNKRFFSVLRLVGYGSVDFLKIYLLAFFVFLVPYFAAGACVYLIIERRILMLPNSVLASYRLVFSDYLITGLIVIAVLFLINIKGLKTVFSQKIEVNK